MTAEYDSALKFYRCHLCAAEAANIDLGVLIAKMDGLRARNLLHDIHEGTQGFPVLYQFFYDLASVRQRWVQLDDGMEFEYASAMFFCMEFLTLHDRAFEVPAALSCDAQTLGNIGSDIIATEAGQRIVDLCLQRAQGDIDKAREHLNTTFASNFAIDIEETQCVELLLAFDVETDWSQSIAVLVAMPWLGALSAESSFVQHWGVCVARATKVAYDFIACS
ncbi:hypothetical protein N9L68_08120 [bacterium]|nr:hypothetical protein [bacterium]